MSIALVGFALLMVLPALLARRHVGESAARHILVERVAEALSGLAVVALGGLVAGVGALARLVLGHVERR